VEVKVTFDSARKSKVLEYCFKGVLCDETDKIYVANGSVGRAVFERIAVAGNLATGNGSEAAGRCRGSKAAAQDCQ
jgi:hypothetical protein